MPVDLFSVILSSGVSWGVGRLLDSLIDCHRCGSGRSVDVNNRSANSFRCYDCGHTLTEYVNATSNTVNRNRSVVAAKIHGTHWPSWQNNFKMYFSLDVVNSKYNEIVVEAVLSRFRGPVFHRYEFIRKPTYDYTYWTDTWFSIGAGNFPSEGGTVAVDINVYNTWGDLLDTDRRLLDYGGGG